MLASVVSSCATGNGVNQLVDRVDPAVVTTVAALPAVCIVGPLPPPSGGMANQARQLSSLLKAEGVPVEFVQTNAPCRPAWIGSIPMVRAVFRLCPYLVRLWLATGRADVVHVFANSGWAWHLFASPALAVAQLRGVPAIVNYRGGLADSFFATAPRWVLRMLRGAALRVTPSTYLQRVFGKFGLAAEVIPNIVDLSRFAFAPHRDHGAAPRIVVTRNLEKIYDIPLAIRVFRRVREAFPGASLVIAGTGPEREALQSMVKDLAIDDAVRFTGRVDSADMPALYAGADCMLNPSSVDNMPNSILEAFACGVPVVSTDAGGIPDMAQHGVSALLSPVGDEKAMTEHLLRVLREPDLADSLRHAGLAEARKYDWPQVKQQWLAAYRRVARHEVAS